VHSEQQTAVTSEGQQPHRDPQSFTRGDILAWTVVAYTAIGVTVVGSAAGIVAFVMVTTS
jgi:hypothetical protein